MLFVEVIELNRILDLLMTLNSTYCDVQDGPTNLWISRNILYVECQSESDNMKHWKASNVIPFQA